MKYKIRNLTLNIDTTDGEFTGSCICYIPFKHKAFLEDACGMRKNVRRDKYQPLYEHDYGTIYHNNDKKQYYTDSPDLLIAYLSWLMEQKGKYNVKVEYSNPFWAIHDVQHSINDEAGCSIYVDKYVEEQRLRDAFKLLIKEGYKPTYDLIQEVEKAYSDRFGEDISFEEFFDFELEDFE